MLYRKGVLGDLAKLTGKHLSQSLFFNKVTDLRHLCFPVSFAKFLRTPFLNRAPLVAASEDENMSLKKKTLHGGWISITAKVYRHNKIMGEKNLSCRFEDWLYKECKIKKQASYNYRNLYKFLFFLSFTKIYFSLTFFLLTASNSYIILRIIC